MSLEPLYSKVSEAIRKAESMEDDGDPGAEEAYGEVSQLEEEIARLLPASNAEGALARRGALRAALAAGDFTRAVKLKDRYETEEGATDELRRELIEVWEVARRSRASALTFHWTLEVLRMELTAA
ncbi:MAG: hypothetical protein HYU64_18390 [Armatimonadetes bacterium]|nr:hypothetical protein [Armatimonadota bacterium]